MIYYMYEYNLENKCLYFYHFVCKEAKDERSYIMLKVLHITSGIKSLGCYTDHSLNHMAKLFLIWISKWKQVLN